MKETLDENPDENNNECVYCNSTEIDLQLVSILPEFLKIKPGCVSCENIHSPANKVLACSRCINTKGNLGLYEFYKKLNPNLVWFYDVLPRHIEKRYLKLMYHCHECADTLDRGDLDGDRELTVLDIDYILH